MIDLAQLDVGSPASYLIAVLVPALDALIPLLPSETAVIALGVATAGSADPRIAVLVMLAACRRVPRRQRRLPARPPVRAGRQPADLRGRAGRAPPRMGPALPGEVRHPDHRRLPVHSGRPDRGHAHLRAHRLPAAQFHPGYRPRRCLVGELRVLYRPARRPDLRGTALGRAAGRPGYHPGGQRRDRGGPAAAPAGSRPSRHPPGSLHPDRCPGSVSRRRLPGLHISCTGSAGGLHRRRLYWAAEQADVFLTRHTA